MWCNKHNVVCHPSLFRAEWKYAFDRAAAYKRGGLFWNGYLIPFSTTHRRKIQCLISSMFCIYCASLPATNSVWAWLDGIGSKKYGQWINPIKIQSLITQVQKIIIEFCNITLLLMRSRCIFRFNIASER